MTDLVEHAQPETQVSGGQDASLDTTFNEITESSPAEPTREEPKSLADTLSDTWDKLNKPPEPEAPVQPVVEAPPAPVAGFPQTWDATYKDHWTKVPAEVQKFIAEREQKTSQTLNRQQQALRYYEPIGGVLSTMNQLGVKPGTEAQMIQNWMQADRFLSENPPEALKWLAQQFNVDLNQLAGVPKQEAQQNPIDDLFKDPRFDVVKQELDATRAELRALKQQQQQVVGNLTAREQYEVAQQKQSIESELAKFSSDKPYYGQVERRMAVEVTLLKQEEPGLSMRELLDKAYDRAIYATPNIRQQVLAEQQKTAAEKAQKEAAAKAAQAKKISSMNVRTGASASTPTFDGPALDREKLSALYDQIVSGRR